MRRLLLASTGLLAATLLAGCPDRDVSKVNPIQDNVDTKVIPVTLNRDLDILFVVDNSGSMAGEQASLAANFPTFISVLQQIEGGLPNVHIGILSSNVGAAGQASVPGCAGQGDDGNLLVKAGCTGLTAQYISDVANAQGNRVKNYSGGLGTLFSCMTQLGTGGCGFEMHLESMYRALQPGKNPGFYRAGAHLAIVILADEDDCSTEMGTMFGDPTAGLNSPLGPRTSFRCHEFGVKCDNDPNPRAFGTRTGCVPNPTSTYMFEIEKYVQFLRGLKEDPSLVVVAGIVGTDDANHTVVVGPDATTPTNPSVEKSCFIVDPNDPNDGATPPIRTAAFVRSFADRHLLSSICRGTINDSMRELGALIKRVIRDPCLREPVRDRDPLTPELEGDCMVLEVTDPRGAGRVETAVPPCETAGATRPCWRLVPNPGECPDAPGQLAFDVDRGGQPPPPAGTVLEIRCAAP